MMYYMMIVLAGRRVFGVWLFVLFFFFFYLLLGDVKS